MIQAMGRGEMTRNRVFVRALFAAVSCWSEVIAQLAPYRRNWTEGTSKPRGSTAHNRFAFQFA
jgi:hypothetical protein